MGTAKVKKFERKLKFVLPPARKNVRQPFRRNKKNTYICAGMTIRNLYRLSGVRLLER